MHEQDTKELPRGLVRVLEEFVLSPQVEESWHRVDAIRELVDAWSELSAAGRRKWIDSASLRDTPVFVDDCGRTTLDHREAVGSIAVLPRRLVSKLAKTILGSADPASRLWLMNELVGNWHALTLDEDHMLGHLIRQHGIDDLSLRSASLDDLTSLHADRHAAQR